VILGGRYNHIWWESTFVLRNARFRVFGPDLTPPPCGSIMYVYSHLPLAKIWASLGVPSFPIRSRRKSPVPEGTPLDLRLPHGKIGIILQCNLWAVGWSLEDTF